jgi:EpsI family protein
LNSDLGSLPAQIDEWFVDSAPDSRPAFRLARADNELLRVYRHPSGDTIRLYVGYHQYQTEGKELIDGRKGAPAGLASHIRLSMPPETFQLNQVVQQAGGAQTGVLFWYDVNGRILSDLYVAKGYTVWDAVTRGRTNAALVMIEWTGSSRDDFERSRERVLEFADSVVRLLRGYLPTQHAGYVEASP